MKAVLCYPCESLARHEKELVNAVRAYCLPIHVKEKRTESLLIRTMKKQLPDFA